MEGVLEAYKLWIGIGIGFFVGASFGVFVHGLLQMVQRGDNAYKDAVQRKLASFAKPEDYFNHFMPERRRCDRRATVK